MLADTLRSLVGLELTDEDGEVSILELLPPASAVELAKLEAGLPAPLPEDIRAALGVSKGLANGPLETFSLLDLPGFGMEEMFPNAHAIAHDGFGNYWFIDLMPDSIDWSPVWFGCHDPPVIIYQSETIERFLLDAIATRRPGPRSPVDIVREDAASRVYRDNLGAVDRAAALVSNDADIRAFAQELPDGAYIVDLRRARMGEGITWGRFGPRTLNFRHGAERIWASAPPPRQASFFERLFGK